MPHLPTFATSGPARLRSAPLGRSKRPLEPARLRQGARNGRSSQIGSAWALEMAARASSAPPGRSKWPLEPAALGMGARSGRSNSLGSARPLEIARPGCSKTRHLPTWTGDASLGRTTNACCAPLGDEHSRACYARVRTSIYICTHIFTYTYHVTPISGVPGSQLFRLTCLRFTQAFHFGGQASGIQGNP